MTLLLCIVIFLISFILGGAFFGSFSAVILIFVFLSVILVFIAYKVEKKRQISLNLEFQRQEEARQYQLIRQQEAETLRRDKLLEQQQLEQQKQTDKYNASMKNLIKIPAVVSQTSIPRLDVNEMPDIPNVLIPKDEEKILSFCDYIVIDVKTTGLSPKKEDIIEVAAIRFINFEPKEYFHTLINPGYLTYDSISDINGITDDMLKDAPPFDVIAQSLIDFISTENIIVSHNIEFDMRFLYANGVNLFSCKRKFVDTLTIAQGCLKKYNGNQGYEYDVEDHKLPTLLDFFNIYTPTNHRALEDSLATGELFKKLLNYRI